MLVIRLQRTGRRNNATFRVVLQERSQAPKSKALEILGSYNPHLKERADQVKLKKERIEHWLSVGAQPSNTIHNMLVEFGIISSDKKRSVTGKNKNAEEGGDEAPAEAAAEGDNAEAPAEESTDAPAEAPAEEAAEETPAEESTEEAAE